METVHHQCNKHRASKQAKRIALVSHHERASEWPWDQSQNLFLLHPHNWDPSIPQCTDRWWIILLNRIPRKIELQHVLYMLFALLVLILWLLTIGNLRRANLAIYFFRQVGLTVGNDRNHNQGLELRITMNSDLFYSRSHHTHGKKQIQRVLLQGKVQGRTALSLAW